MEPLRLMILGYLVTVVIEGMILWVGLSQAHASKDRIIAALWLTACTYPVVVLVIPALNFAGSRLTYILIAELFAVVVEVVLFIAAFPASDRTSQIRDGIAIGIANAASFLAGEAWWRFGADAFYYNGTLPSS